MVSATTDRNLEGFEKFSFSSGDQISEKLLLTSDYLQIASYKRSSTESGVIESHSFGS